MGYRLRETDLRLKRPKQPALATETGAPSTRLKQSNSNSTPMISRSPSPAPSVPPVSYREMRQRGFRGTKYDAELLLASQQQHQGFGLGQANVAKIWSHNPAAAAGVDGTGGFFRHRVSESAQPQAAQVVVSPGRRLTRQCP